MLLSLTRWTQSFGSDVVFSNPIFVIKTRVRKPVRKKPKKAPPAARKPRERRIGSVWHDTSGEGHRCSLRHVIDSSASQTISTNTSAPHHLEISTVCEAYLQSRAFVGNALHDFSRKNFHGSARGESIAIVAATAAEAVALLNSASLIAFAPLLVLLVIDTAHSCVQLHFAAHCHATLSSERRAGTIPPRDDMAWRSPHVRLARTKSTTRSPAGSRIYHQEGESAPSHRRKAEPLTTDGRPFPRLAKSLSPSFD